MESEVAVAIEAKCPTCGYALNKDGKCQFFGFPRRGPCSDALENYPEKWKVISEERRVKRPMWPH